MKVNDASAVQASDTGADHRPYLVGVGSSAGGLEALTALVSALPSNLGIAYVVVQHMSPTHRSMLAQLLGRETAMAVQEVKDNSKPEPDVIYIAPASMNTVLQEGRLRLLETKRESLPRPSINTFFASLAAEKNDDAIGIVLSGTGTDGTAGLREIKANGGYTFAQDPNTAKYNGMPQSAIDSGCVDWVLSAEKIAVEITAIVRNRPSMATIPELTQPPSIATQLKKLLLNIKHKTRIDFSGYKEGTLWRRIERRMAANHFFHFEDYLKFTDSNPEELDRLGKDILISVTAFFRDQDAFAKLNEIIRVIVSNKQPGDEIRIWVPGCATGEEAYSIAILLAEALGSNLSMYRIQIFATDIDGNAMSIARKGLYVEGALAELEQTLVNRYFNPRHDRFEISRTLREMVVFARQDLIQDPPFLRLDLISCRNVLIYLQNDLQMKILTTFHYGLRDGGFLFLGKSESVFQHDILFEDIHKSFRIFRRRPCESKIRLTSFQLPLLNEKLESSQVKQNNAEHKLLEAVLRAYVPATILVNKSLDIQYIYGDVSPFLTISAGKPSVNLMHLLLREFRSDLQLLQHQAEQHLEPAFGKYRSIRFGETKRNVRLVVHPAEKGVETPFFLVSFEQAVSEIKMNGQLHDYPLDSDAKQTVMELEDELVMTRERLQTVIEQLETSNEQLQSLNEEVQSASEELQTSFEELEASNEELQSTNEELTTVNEELQVRTNELAETLNDLEKVQNSVGFPILAVNEQLQISRFNTPAAGLFLLAQTSINQPLSTLRLPLGMADFSGYVQHALDIGKVIEVAMPSVERHYLMHISPYETTQCGVRGAILTLVDDTERLASENEVISSREKLLSIMNNSTAMISLKDIAGRYEFVNRQFEKIFNITLEDILGKTDSQILSQHIADDFRAKELEVVRKLQTIESEDHLQHGDVDLYMLSIRFPLIGADGLPYGVCTQSSDITARVQAESQLRLAARVFDRSSEGIVVTDTKKQILTINEAFTTITGYSAEEIIGKKPSFLTSGLQDKQFFEAMWSSIHSQGWWQGEILNRRKSGDIYPEWLTINAIQDHTGKTSSYVAIFSDISIIKESQQRIEFLATHDPLTELPNRLLFLDRVRQAVARGSRGTYLFAVLFIDLDDFKVVNDSLGHAAGDSLLKQVAKLMRSLVRAVDTVARFGGDEFALLIENTTVEEVENTARRLCAAVGRSMYLGDQMAHVGASVGIAVFPNDSTDAEILLKHADTAMYEAKAKGKNAYQFFTKAMMEQADTRLWMENGLRQAIEKQYLLLHYQPQIDLASGHLIGVEALVRWLDPEQGLIPPDKFIPLAEKCGLIEKLGEWVANEACIQMVNWLAAGYKLPHLSINVSMEQFRRGGVLNMMQRLLENHDLPAHYFMLEITESALADDNNVLLETLQSLKRLGLKISIDDFGTGYSSLSRLKSYPIDELKIDRSFVDDITEQGQDLIITQTIIAMGKTLGFLVVAEGVETEAQLDTLRGLNCDIVQGFLLSKPLPADQMSELLAAAAQLTA